VHAVRAPAKLAVSAFIVALLAGGCSSSQAKPSVTSADVTACHDFGNEVIIHGATTTSAERVQVMDEMGLTNKPTLRSEANAMKAAIAAENPSRQLSAAKKIAKVCYALGLVGKTGQPT
jgi:hypothetical protein